MATWKCQPHIRLRKGLKTDAARLGQGGPQRHTATECVGDALRALTRSLWLRRKVGQRVEHAPLRRASWEGRGAHAFECVQARACRAGLTDPVSHAASAGAAPCGRELRAIVLCTP